MESSSQPRPGDAIGREIKDFQAANPLLPSPPMVSKVLPRKTELGEGRRCFPPAKLDLKCQVGRCYCYSGGDSASQPLPARTLLSEGCLLQDLPIQEQQGLPLCPSLQHTPAATTAPAQKNGNSGTDLPCFPRSTKKPSARLFSCC